MISQKIGSDIFLIISMLLFQLHLAGLQILHPVLTILFEVQ
jgi:hypothetical protein